MYPYLYPDHTPTVYPYQLPLQVPPQRVCGRGWAVGGCCLCDGHRKQRFEVCIRVCMCVSVCRGVCMWIDDRPHCLSSFAPFFHPSPPRLVYIPKKEFIRCASFHLHIYFIYLSYLSINISTYMAHSTNLPPHPPRVMAGIINSSSDGPQENRAEYLQDQQQQQGEGGDDDLPAFQDASDRGGTGPGGGTGAGARVAMTPRAAAARRARLPAPQMPSRRAKRDSFHFLQRSIEERERRLRGGGGGAGAGFGFEEEEEHVA